ncbi:hypothetical protein [Gluconobacter cerinus]|uniref:hypothetical protein n=1 Tax=Gluconobacter cerinus TaxID=38307 RepID=UPI001B8CC798|nr:hypothetical protein [Gluconobacter cerinus]MBS1067164.1 hypothetical protein [Gluconobacter cerinus]
MKFVPALLTSLLFTTVAACHKKPADTAQIKIDMVHCEMQSGQFICSGTMNYNRMFSTDAVPSQLHDKFINECVNHSLCNVELVVPKADEKASFIKNIIGMSWKQSENDKQGLLRQSLGIIN